MSDGEDSLMEDEMDFDMNDLSKKDPDFYQFLLENEKSLLDFDAEDEEDYDDEDGDDDDEQEDAGKKKKKMSSKSKVTEATLVDWCGKLRESSGTTGSIGIIKNLMEVFRTAAATLSSDKTFKSQFKLDPDLFNTITRICFTEMTPELFRLLGLPVPGSSENKTSENKTSQMKDVTKCKNWKAVASPTIKYLKSLIQVMNIVSDEAVVCGLLRHSLHLVPFIHSNVSLLRLFVRRVSDVWSSSAEKVRVLSFLCVVRLIRDQNSEMIDFALKKMYMSFAKNSRLTTLDSIPMISFMQQSLVELYSLDQSIAYNHTFVFLRQCAVTLRNAMSKPSKETYKMVYCWPYIHSLILWQKVLSCLHPSDVMKPLIHPLIQVMTGAIKLTVSTQFEPLRLHLIRSMVRLSQDTGVFIPVIPFVAGLLERIQYNHSKKNKQETTEKKVDLNCILRVSKKESTEKWYQQILVKSCYEILLDYYAGMSHRIGFPELAFPPVVRLKKFVKDCKNPEDSRLVKQVLEKIEENSKYITIKRSVVTFKFSDTMAVESWESDRLKERTPLNDFYSKWKVLRKESLKREMQEIKDHKEGKRKNGHEDEEDDGEEINTERNTKDKIKRRVSRQQEVQASPTKKTKRKRNKSNKTKTPSNEGNDFEIKGLVMSDDDD